MGPWEDSSPGSGAPRPVAGPVCTSGAVPSSSPGIPFWLPSCPAPGPSRTPCRGRSPETSGTVLLGAHPDCLRGDHGRAGRVGRKLMQCSLSLWLTQNPQDGTIFPQTLQDKMVPLRYPVGDPLFPSKPQDGAVSSSFFSGQDLSPTLIALDLSSVLTVDAVCLHL